MFNNIAEWWKEKHLCCWVGMHQSEKRMTYGDYHIDSSTPETYVLTVCDDCGTITHGRWMGGNDEVQLEPFTEAQDRLLEKYRNLPENWSNIFETDREKGQ